VTAAAGPVTEVVRAGGPHVPGLLRAVERRLGELACGHGADLAVHAGATIAAGGKRLRPLLVFLSAPEKGEPPVAAGVAVELVHMATLVHDDLIDRARVRRGRAAAWTAHGPDAARAAGDYLFARAFAELAAEGDADAVRTLADASLALARGEALQRRQRHDPDTPVEGYLARCELKTGKLFEAACALGGGNGDLFGEAAGLQYLEEGSVGEFAIGSHPADPRTEPHAPRGERPAMSP